MISEYCLVPHPMTHRIYQDQVSVQLSCIVYMFFGCLGAASIWCNISHVVSVNVKLDSLDCVHRIPLPSPSPITVAPIGATVDRYPLHRIPLPPPLPSRFLLSPAKWMGTLPRSPPPRSVASQTSARDRNTPWSELQAIQPRPQRRRRR
jgi:hypothetical protein